MINEVIGIYGASGFGKEVLPLVVQQFPSGDIYFIDDNITSNELNGIRVLTLDLFNQLPSSSKKVVIAIADKNIRRSLTHKIKTLNLECVTIFSQNSFVLGNVNLGEGSIVCPFVTLTSDIEIGLSFQANLYSYVAHDCVIGDFVTFAPAVKCNGNVIIEDGAYIGTGAIIKQGTPSRPLVIGKDSVVGMGSVVTKSVTAGDTVFGAPAKSIYTKRTMK